MAEKNIDEPVPFEPATAAKPKAKFTEKQLDEFLEARLKESEEFLTWFLNQTKFANRKSRIKLLNASHPWHKSKRTGIESETDILLVLQEVETSEVFAIHIENKKHLGKFMLNQPQLYHDRADEWRGMEKWGAYDDFEVVLTAPQKFYDENLEQSKIFHRFISHEAISQFIPEFAIYTGARDINL